MLLVGYLLTCGDVKLKPGPGTGQEAGYNGRAQGKEAKRGVHTQPAQPSRFSQQPLDSFHAEISHILNQAVARMESTTRHSIEQRLQSVEEKIDHRLREAEVNQAQLSSSVDGLRSQCQALWSENQDLKTPSTISSTSATTTTIRADVTIFFSLALNRHREVRNPGRTVKEK